MIDLRMPNITASNPIEQIGQVRSYLYQLTNDLQFALHNLETGVTNVNNTVDALGGKTDKQTNKEQTAINTFNEIKTLIIKSADIVNAYYTKLVELFQTSGEFVAQSDFGTYKEETSQILEAFQTNITQLLTSVETITGIADGLADMMKTQLAYIKYGIVGTTLDDTHLADLTAPGIEIGDYEELQDGEDVYTNARYSRFTAYGIELFGENKEYPVAYVKQRKLYITEAELTERMKLGEYMMSRADGVSFDWVG